MHPTADTGLTISSERSEARQTVARVLAGQFPGRALLEQIKALVPVAPLMPLAFESMASAALPNLTAPLKRTVRSAGYTVPVKIRIKTISNTNPMPPLGP